MKYCIHWIFLIAFLSFVPLSSFAGDLKAFTTDGCSSFPDGTLNNKDLWINCCVSHDLSYWKGGTYEEREQADKTLEQCVEKVGEPEIAKIMLAGVRVGGSPYFPTSYRWGYGWPYMRGYKALTDEEKQEVKEKLELFRLTIKAFDDELQQLN